MTFRLRLYCTLGKFTSAVWLIGQRFQSGIIFCTSLVHLLLKTYNCWKGLVFVRKPQKVKNFLLDYRPWYFTVGHKVFWSCIPTFINSIFQKINHRMVSLSIPSRRKYVVRKFLQLLYFHSKCMKLQKERLKINYENSWGFTIKQAQLINPHITKFRSDPIQTL